MRPAPFLSRTIFRLAAVGLPMAIGVAAACSMAPATAATIPGNVRRLEDPLPIFRWFDTLGFPDIRGARFVRITSGRWCHGPGRTPRILYSHGFLLDEDDATFRALVL